MDGEEIAYGILALLWWAAKIVFLPILIVNIVYLVQAANAGTVDQFDWFWFFASILGLVLL